MKRILIVDDVDKIREIYKKLLIDEGFVVFEASNVYKAIQIFSEEPIDLVLLDIFMPRIDGAKLFNLIDKSDKNLKVIIASVYAIDEQKKRIVNAMDYYDKSQGTEVLLEKVKIALSV